MTAVKWVLIILGAWFPGACVLACALIVIPAAWRKVRALGARLVSDQPARDAHHPGLPCDGRPLSVPERERLEQIRRGMWKTAPEPGRQR